MKILGYDITAKAMEESGMITKEEREIFEKWNRRYQAIAEEGVEFAVEGRKLHRWINDCKGDYSHWIKRHIEHSGCVEGTDFTSKMAESTGGRPSHEYWFTLEGAQFICMSARGKGNQAAMDAKRYFVICSRIVTSGEYHLKLHRDSQKRHNSTIYQNVLKEQFYVKEYTGKRMQQINAAVNRKLFGSYSVDRDSLSGEDKQKLTDALATVTGMMELDFRVQEILERFSVRPETK